MKTIIKLAVFAALFHLSAWSFGQCLYDPYFHNCTGSPLSTSHAFTDVLELTESKLGQSSQTTFTLTTPENYLRPFDLRQIYIDPKDHPENFVISGCPTPMHADFPKYAIQCEVTVTWTPQKAGIQKARLYFYALYDDDFSDISHTVLLMGYARGK